MTLRDKHDDDDDDDNNNNGGGLKKKGGGNNASAPAPGNGIGLKQADVEKNKTLSTWIGMNAGGRADGQHDNNGQKNVHMSKYVTMQVDG